MIWLLVGTNLATLGFIGWRARRVVAKANAKANKTVADCNRRTSLQITQLRAANGVLVQRAAADSHRADQLAMENARLRQKLAELAVTL